MVIQVTNRTKAVINSLLTGACVIITSASLDLSSLKAQQSASSDISVLPTEIVSVRRQDENAQSVATSLSIMNAADLSKSNITNLENVFEFAPNVNMNDWGSPGSGSLTIRGISSAQGGIYTSVPVYVDELNLGIFLTNPILQDVERTEVLKGPQATYFGGNSTGGAVNITNAVPTSKFETNTFFEVGNLNTYTAGGTINLPLSKALRIRATSYYYNTRGSLKNLYPTGGTDNQENSNMRIAMAYLPTDRLSNTTSFTYNNEFSGMNEAVPTGVLGVSAIGTYGTLTPYNTGLPYYPTNNSTVDQYDPNSTAFRYWILNNKFNYTFDNFKLTSVTGLARFTNHQYGDGDTSFKALDVRGNVTNGYLRSQEFRVTSSLQGPLSFTVGANYNEQSNKPSTEVVLGPQNPFGAPSGIVFFKQNQNFLLENRAIFGEADYKITNKLTFTYGARYSSDSQFASQVGVSATPNGYVTSAIPLQSGSFSNFSNKFALRDQLTDNVNVYLLASQGYRDGGIQGNSLPHYSPETLWNYEAGIKGTALNNKFRYSLSIFDMQWSNMQVNTTITVRNPSTGAIVTQSTGVQNAAKSYSQGAELEFDTLITKSLKFGGGAGIDSTKFDSFPAAVIPGAIQPINLAGKQLLNAPKQSFNLHLEYDSTFDGCNTYVRIENSYTGAKVCNLLAYVPKSLFPAPVSFAFPFDVPSYDIWNLSAGISKGNYSVTAYAQNLANSNYYTYAYDNLSISGETVDIHPRKIGVRFSYKY